MRRRWVGNRLRALPEFLEAWSQKINGDLFIILDQFEEYFLYHPQEDGDHSFAVQFARAVNRPDLRVSFLISIREDALAKLDRFKGRIPNLFDNYLRIDHLGRDAARAAITEPAQTYNSFHHESPVSIDTELVDAVLNQVKTDEVVLGAGGRGAIEKESNQPTADERIETSYLQLVMTRLWQEEIGAGSRTLRLTTLETLGGAKRIVQTHVDAVMKRLKPDEQRTAAKLFYYLVTPDGTKIAHTVSALAKYTQLEEKHLIDVMEKLCGEDARILQPVEPPPGQPDSPRYEIRHDKLAVALLDWRQKEKILRVRVVAAILVALLMVVGAAAVWAYWSKESQVSHVTGGGGLSFDYLIRGSIIWTVLFFGLLTFAVFTQFTKASVTRLLPDLLRSILKAAPALFLAGVSLYLAHPLVASAFLLCSIGDILLDLPEKDFPHGFRLGAVSFVAALLVFSIACYQTQLAGHPLLPLAITNIVIGLFLLRRVLPKLTSPERVLEVSYFGILLVANLFAATSYVPIFLGSSLWLMSDLTIPLSNTLEDTRTNSLETLGLYDLGLYFLAVGFLNA